MRGCQVDALVERLYLVGIVLQPGGSIRGESVQIKTACIGIAQNSLRTVVGTHNDETLITVCIKHIESILRKGIGCCCTTQVLLLERATLHELLSLTECLLFCHIACTN